MAIVFHKMFAGDDIEDRFKILRNRFIKQLGSPKKNQASLNPYR